VRFRLYVTPTMTRATVGILAVVLSSTCIDLVAGKGFLAKADEVERLLNGAREFLGDSHYHFANKKIAKIEQVLRPLYSAMVKNEHGKLGHAAASYAVHRIFAQRHGWHVTGLESNDHGFSAWRTASPTTVLKKHMPNDILDGFRRGMFPDGFGLHELAIVAATIEYFIHLESMGKIDAVFKAQYGSTGKLLNQPEVDHTLDTYMAFYLIGHMVQVSEKPGLKALHLLVNKIPEIFPNWPATQGFLREVQQSIITEPDQVSFPKVITMVEEVGERYGAFQDEQCRSIKSLLFSLEDTSAGGAGRIRLPDFYGLYLKDNNNQFIESASQLRKLGALDESKAGNPRVIITNYIYGASMCVASSQYYEVCCINQCDNLMAQIEQEIAAPEAYSQQITDFVAALPSPSSPNGKEISPGLRSQLDEVAALNGGRVPLHGRLFAQWMHSAYPRECPFPHVSGSSNPDHLADIIQNSALQEEALATDEEIKRIVAAAPPRSDVVLDANAHEASSMLSMQEELVV